MDHLECSRSLSALFLPLALLAGCHAEQSPPVDPANASYGALTGFDHTVQLVDGKFEGEPFVEGGTSFPAAYLSKHLVREGDLDGDGTAETAVVIVTSGGGSGSFAHLAVLERGSDGGRNVATTPLGDRVMVTALSIDGGTLLLTTTEHSEDDAVCCPTLRVDRQFRLTGDSLVVQAESRSEPPGRIMGFLTWDDTGGDVDGEADGAADRSFRTCNGDRSGYVINGMKRTDVEALYDEFAGAPGDEVFIDAEARWIDSGVAGLSTSHADTLEITRLFRVEGEGFNCSFDPQDVLFSAFGTEPGWRLDVRQDGATLSSADGSENVEFTGDGRLSSRQFEFESPEYRLAVSYLDLPCRNAMSGAWRSHGVEFTIGGSRFKGCAIPGSSAP